MPLASACGGGRSARRPSPRCSNAALLERHEAFLAFRVIVREIFPDAEAEIMAARENGASRETARCWAFVHNVEAELFPVYEVEEYEQLVYAIPFVPNGWSYVIWRKCQGWLRVGRCMRRSTAAR
jgi:hypothetical protein